MGYVERLLLELTATERAATEARHRVLAAARDCAPDGEESETLGLLVSEVVTNAVRHGGTGEPLDVTVLVGDSAIRVEVADSGAGFVPRPRALEPDHVGGWGLYLVEQLASAWGVSSSDRTTVWFELPCTRAQAA